MRLGKHGLRFDRNAAQTAKLRRREREDDGKTTPDANASTTRVTVKNMRDRLVALRTELEAAAESAEGSSAIVELDQSKVGRLSRMDAMQAQAMAKASDQRREATLRRVAAALKRIDDGEYGVCQSCDEPINPKRLEFDPTVLLCIDCASKSEQN
jgi:DnaK suppressor protein